AESHARKAISLDAGLGEPHAVLGYMDLRLFRWESCELHLRRALEIDDSLPVPHQWYSNFLNDVGRHDDANREAMTAHAMDPLSPTANNILAFTALFRGDDRTAKKHIDIARKYGIGGVIPAYVDFLLALRNAEYEKAIEDWSQHLERSKLSSDWLLPVVAAIEDPAKMTQAEAALDKARRNNEIDVHNQYFHYVLLGNEKAFSAAQEQLHDHSLAHTWLMLPEAKALRDSQGFATLMKEIGVMDYWRNHGFPGHLQSLQQAGQSI
ncbi:MAG: hypothetical protein HKM98_03150, partial [Gammaproteobacteria bacterium]|nr:hypothetical protein [Gammaproteobacteria bacterium]